MSEYTQLPLFDPLEAWEPVPGFEDLYAISNKGRIKALLSASNGAYKAGRILRPWPTTNGYMSISLVRDTKRKTFRVHRLVAQVFIGECPTNHEVNHKDGNKTNNSVDNLEYMTHRDNQLHSYHALGQKRGHKKGNKQLRNDQVRDIRNRLETETVRNLARQFGVSRATVLNIKHGKTWAHIK